MIVAVRPSGPGDPANRPLGRLPNHYTMIVAVRPSGPGDPANRPLGRLPNHYIMRALKRKEKNAAGRSPFVLVSCDP